MAQQKALEGDASLLKVFVDKAMPNAKGTLAQVEDLPPLRTASDAPAALAAILAAAGRGEITLEDADRLTGLVTKFLSALEVVEFEHRLRALEGRDMVDIRGEDHGLEPI